MRYAQYISILMHIEQIYEVMCRCLLNTVEASQNDAMSNTIFVEKQTSKEIAKVIFGFGALSWQQIQFTTTI